MKKGHGIHLLENQLSTLHMEEIQRKLFLSGDTNRKKDRVAADTKEYKAS